MVCSILSAPYFGCLRAVAVGDWGGGCLWWLWDGWLIIGGRYPYPLFDALSPPWRAVLFAGSALLMTLSTACLKWAYGRVNGYGVESVRARPGAVKE